MNFKKTFVTLTASLALFGAVAPAINTVNNVQAATHHTKKSKKHGKKRKSVKIPYQIVRGSQPVQVYVTKNTPALAYNLATGKMHHTKLGASQTVTIYPGTHNTWIVTTGIDNAWGLKHYRFVITQQSGWYITKDELNRRTQNARNRFNNSLEAREGRDQVNAWRNKLNQDGTNIRNWIG
ncbi:hypothetical protein [Lactobacillus helveticus]|uniref:hypothetical protein n=1 Tax=Lactobacillus helveticus TaxID=1587 RepID=UPI001107B842|nr:hypothetical protein [Lactobacillus helveticus]TLQ21533.1 hypothetical protein FEZ38_07000 [Lactobacillus helveticus]